MLDPAQSPRNGPEEHATDSHHDNEPVVVGLSWLQRRQLWPQTTKEYRWDTYRRDGGLQVAITGKNQHSSNMLHM